MKDLFAIPNLLFLFFFFNPNKKRHKKDQISQGGIAAITTYIGSNVTKLIDTSFSGYFTCSLKHYLTQAIKSPSLQTKDVFVPIF